MEVQLSSDVKQVKLKKGFLFELKKNFPFFTMLLPGSLYLLIFCYLPMPGILIAFKNYKMWGRNVFENFFKSEWVGLNNFKFMFTTPDVFLMTRNTVLYNLVFIAVGMIFGISVAIGINELTSVRLAKLYQSCFFLPYFLSWMVVSLLAFTLLNSNFGILNGILKNLGAQPIDWYMEKKYWPFIIVIAYLWKYVGNGSIVYLATITSFDQEIYQSAAIDGAGRWKQITKITIPMLMPMMVLMAILSIGGIFRADFGLFFALPNGSGMLKSVTMVIDTYVYNSLGLQLGMPTAAGLYQSIVGFILVLTTNQIVKKLEPGMKLF